MKLGILGTGMIVKDLLQIYHQFDIDETYILGTQQTKEETEKLVENYHFNGTYYDYEEMLKSDIDTIYCALPNHLHFSFSKKASLSSPTLNKGNSSPPSIRTIGAFPCSLDVYLFIK